MVVSVNGYKVYIYRYIESQYIINQTIIFTERENRRASLSGDGNYLVINN